MRLTFKNVAEKFHSEELLDLDRSNNRKLGVYYVSIPQGDVYFRTLAEAVSWLEEYQLENSVNAVTNIPNPIHPPQPQPQPEPQPEPQPQPEPEPQSEPQTEPQAEPEPQSEDVFYPACHIDMMPWYASANYENEEESNYWFNWWLAFENSKKLALSSPARCNGVYFGTFENPNVRFITEPIF